MIRIEKRTLKHNRVAARFQIFHKMGTATELKSNIMLINIMEQITNRNYRTNFLGNLKFNSLLMIYSLHHHYHQLCSQKQ